MFSVIKIIYFLPEVYSHNFILVHQNLGVKKITMGSKGWG